MQDYIQGISLSSSDENFEKSLQASVDYRGDVTFHLTDGSHVTGFAFNWSQGQIEYFPTGLIHAKTLPKSEILKVEFSGQDTANGKSWEDWQKKKAMESALSSSITN